MTLEAIRADATLKPAEQESERISVSMTVNRRLRTVAVEPRMTLLDALREVAGADWHEEGVRSRASAELAPCMSRVAAFCPA